MTEGVLGSHWGGYVRAYWQKNGQSPDDFIYPVMKKLMKEKVIFDGRNIYDPSELEEHGFQYYGIGRS